MVDPIRELILDNVGELTVNTSLLLFILRHLVDTGSLQANDVTVMLDRVAANHGEERVASVFRERAAQWRAACDGPATARVHLRVVATDGVAVEPE